MRGRTTPTIPLTMSKPTTKPGKSGAKNIGAKSTVKTAAALGVWKDYKGADAETLEITFELSTDFARLALEQVGPPRQFAALRLVDGKARAGVAPGEYILDYRGKTDTPNEKYTIEVTAPASAKWSPTPPQRSDDGCNVLGIRVMEVE